MKLSSRAPPAGSLWSTQINKHRAGLIFEKEVCQKGWGARSQRLTSAEHLSAGAASTQSSFDFLEEMVSEEEEPQLNRDGPGLYNSTMSSMNDHILLVKRTTLQVVAESSDNNASNNKPLAYMTEIQQTKTFDSTSSAEDLSHGISRRRRRRRKSPHLDIDWKLLSCWEDFISTVYHIGCFAILGTSLRCFIGRFFGSDCTNVEFDNNPVGDFVQPFASKICITSDGRMKAGGSVFTDLPANMLGS